jgi:hypothetical protein
LGTLCSKRGGILSTGPPDVEIGQGTPQETFSNYY